MFGLVLNYDVLFKVFMFMRKCVVVFLEKDDGFVYLILMLLCFNGRFEVGIFFV